MSDYLVLDGMDEDVGSLLMDGLIGEPSGFVRESLHKEFLHPLPARKAGPEEHTIAFATQPGEKVEGRLRGIGQFGLFRKVTSEDTDWTFKIYTDPQKTMKIAEFSG